MACTNQGLGRINVPLKNGYGLALLGSYKLDSDTSEYSGWRIKVRSELSYFPRSDSVQLGKSFFTEPENLTWQTSFAVSYGFSL